MIDPPGRPEKPKPNKPVTEKKTGLLLVTMDIEINPFRGKRPKKKKKFSVTTTPKMTIHKTILYMFVRFF